MKPRTRTPPRLEEDQLTDTFVDQLTTGKVGDAAVSGIALPSLDSLRGQAVTIDGCLLQTVTLADPKAQRLQMRDVRVGSSDLANVDLTGSLFERCEFLSTRLTGATCPEASFRSVLFRECTLDLAAFRMARFQLCVFERCNLVEADFYNADLTGTLFRDCDLSRADISHAKLTGADLRGCRIDAVRGTPASVANLVISPDQAPLLITLFGVRVVW